MDNDKKFLDILQNESHQIVWCSEYGMYLSKGLTLAELIDLVEKNKELFSKNS